jgi:hypothetical protein
MSETRKTMTLGVVALLLLLAAVLSAPRRSTPDEFLDRGEAFFPEFTDPAEATALEVVEFNEETASARPFKVAYRDGRWTVPSHHDYPADGEDRLAKTAAGMIGLNKDDFRTSNLVDHEACGVIDPLDEAVTTLRGRGKRVTIRGENDRVLADLIFGRTLEDRPDFRFVRVPGQSRVYVSRANVDISTRFADWIEPHLLQVQRDDVTRVVVRDYSINERTRTVDQRDVLILTREGDDWTANRMPAGQEVDSLKISQLLRAIEELSIVGVRPKPPGLSADLRSEEGRITLSQANVLALQSRGYYLTLDGQLLSNEGETEVFTDRGVRFILRFGEVLYGRGEAISDGDESTGDEESGPGENRYLFITASFDPEQLREPPRPSDTAFRGKSEEEMTDTDRRNRELQQRHDEWRAAIEAGRARAAELNERFADWYYVIPAEAFERIHIKRSDLLRPRED